MLEGKNQKTQIDHNVLVNVMLVVISYLRLSLSTLGGLLVFPAQSMSRRMKSISLNRVTGDIYTNDPLCQL